MPGRLSYGKTEILSFEAAVCREVSKQSFAGKITLYQFPILEMGLFLLVLFGLEFLLSAWTAGRQKSSLWLSGNERWDSISAKHFMTSRDHLITKALKPHPLPGKIIRARLCPKYHYSFERRCRHECTDDGWAFGRQLQHQASLAVRP